MFVIGMTLCVLLLIAAASLAVWQYIVYKRLYEVRLPSPKEKRQQLKKARDLHFFQYNRFLIAAFSIAAFVVVILGFWSVSSQNKIKSLTAAITSLQKDVKDMKTLSSGSSTTGDTNDSSGTDVSIEDYTMQDWHITEFSWKECAEALGEKDTRQEVKKSYETELSDQLYPFFGSTLIEINANKTAPTLNLSIVAVGLPENQAQIVKENARAVVQELNSVNEIAMVSFSFSFGEVGKYRKESMMFYREDNELKELQGNQ